MCDCDVNISNIPNENVYTCSNLPDGFGLYAGTMVTDNVSTFEFKTLKPGTNVSLTSDANTITISSTDTGATSISNNGGGAAVGQNITGTTLNLRTLTGTFGSSVTQLANTVNIKSDNQNFLNIGTGQGVFSVSGGQGSGLQTNQFKTLKSGNGLAVTSDSDSITFSSTCVNTLNQVGGGSQVAQSITGNTLNLRTITGSFGSNVTQNANTLNIKSDNQNFLNLGAGAGVFSSSGGIGSGLQTNQFKSVVAGNGIGVTTNSDTITINNDQIQSNNNTIIYNYGQTVTGVDLGGSYISPTGVSSNDVSSLENVSGNTTNPGLTSLDYIPGARWTSSTFMPFNTIANNGTVNASYVKLFPNTQVTNDVNSDYILGLATDGNVYQLNMVTENIMLKYDGSKLVLSPTPSFIAMDYDDAILFFASGDEIYTYDFALDTTTFLFNVNSLAGWNASMRYMYYSKSVLYFLDKDAKFWLISIKPFDRNLSIVISYGTAYKYKYVLGTDMFTFSINDETGLPLITNNFAGITRISACNTIGSSPNAFEFEANSVENNSSLYLTIAGASGRVYVYSPDNNKFYRYNYGESIENGLSGIYGTSNTYLSLTRSPYGIIA